MIRKKWDVEEAVALMHVYFEYGGKITVDSEVLENLSRIMKKRANVLGFDVDESFRNVTGLDMQLACIHYVVTDGKEGLSNTSTLFYDTYELYLKNPKIFSRIYDEFIEKYC